MMRTRVLPFAIGVLCLIGVSQLAGADSSNGLTPLAIRAVDAREGRLTVDIMSDGTFDASQATISVNGQRVDGSLASAADAKLSAPTIVVLDNSSEASNATVQLALEDLKSLKLGDGALSTLGVVTTGSDAEGGARLRAPLSNSLSAIESSTATIGRSGSSHLWEGISLAAKSFGEAKDQLPQIVVVNSTSDFGKGSLYSAVQREVLDAGAVVHVYQVGGAGSSAELRTLAAATGGSIRSGSDERIGEFYTVVHSAANAQWRFSSESFSSATADSFWTIRVEADGRSVAGSFRPGAYSSGQAELAYVAPREDAGGFFAKSWVKYAVAGTAALFVSLGLIGAMAFMMKRRDTLDHALRHYDDGYGDHLEVDGNAVAASALIQRGVAAAEQIGARHGVLAGIDRRLEQADLPLRAAEGLFFSFLGLVASAALVLVITKSLLITIVVALIVGLLPRVVLNVLVKRRYKKFQAQLPEMLQLMAGTLRAGFSIAQGFEAISHEIEDPMGVELRKAMAETALGRPLDEALEALAHRVGSEDFEWTVLAIRIQREVGGNLAELLMGVADTMVQRERLRRDVLTLTAEGRMSAIVLGGLPLGLGVILYFMNPEYMSKLFSGLGLALLVGAALSMAIGFFAMKKCIEIEI